MSDNLELKKYQIAVIGGGAAGIMGALRGVLNNDNVILFTGSAKDKKRSRDMWVTKVENMPGYHDFKKGIVDPNKITVEWLLESDFKDKFTLKKGTGVEAVKKNLDKTFEITDSKGEKYLAEYVVLATGIMDVQPHLDGTIDKIFPYANAQTADYCLRCDGHHVLGKHTSIIGAGDGAGWVAIMLKERYDTPSMSILTNGKESTYSDEVKKLLDLYKIETYDSEIVDVVGDKKSGELKGYKFASGREIESQFTFVSLGTIVYNELAKSVGAEVDKRGYVLTNDKGMTKVDNFYVAGDIRAGFKKQIYTAWDMAVDTLDDINRKIRTKKRLALLAE